MVRSLPEQPDLLVPSLVLVGHSGAGKSTLARVLANQTRLPVIEMGHVVRAEAAAYGASSPLAYADQVFRGGNGGHFAARAADRLTGRPGPYIFVGPRRPEEVDLLRQRLGHSLLVGIDAPQDVRRVRRREEAERLEDLRWLERRDETESDWGLQRLLASADLRLDGTRTVEELAFLLGSQWVLASEDRGPLWLPECAGSPRI